MGRSCDIVALNCRNERSTPRKRVRVIRLPSDDRAFRGVNARASETDEVAGGNETTNDTRVETREVDARR